MRLAFINTNLLNARFVVVGGTNQAVETLFDKAHPKSPDREGRRTSFGELFKRDMADTKRDLLASDWAAHFPEIAERLPDTVFANFGGMLKAECASTVGNDSIGHVFVWNCTRTRGGV